MDTNRQMCWTPMGNSVNIKAQGQSSSQS